MVISSQYYFSQIVNNYNVISNRIDYAYFEVLVDLLHQLNEAVPIVTSLMISHFLYLGLFTQP